MSDLSRSTSTPYALRAQSRLDYAERRRRSQRNGVASNAENSLVEPDDSASNFEAENSGARSASTPSAIATASDGNEINNSVHEFVDLLNERLMGVGVRVRFSDIRPLTDKFFGLIGRMQENHNVAFGESHTQISYLRHRLDGVMQELLQVKTQLGETIGENNLLLDRYQMVSDDNHRLNGDIRELRRDIDHLRRELRTVNVHGTGHTTATLAMEQNLHNRIREQACLIERLTARTRYLQQRIDIATDDPDWVDVEHEASPLVASAQINNF